ncbi:MAG: ribonuclease, partial [Haemophilus influenzae]|nr:ribonuclease [Haemophilus influenzae]
MKKQVSTLSLIALAALSIWQYFTEHKKETKPTPTTTQQQTQSAVKNTNDFGNYDVIMRDDAIGQNKNAPVDYYMLALSWSPAFCEKQRAQYGNNLPDSA